MTRDSTVRPSGSVPNQCAPAGPVLAEAGFCTSGLYGAKEVAEDRAGHPEQDDRRAHEERRPAPPAAATRQACPGSPRPPRPPRSARGSRRSGPGRPRARTARPGSPGQPARPGHAGDGPGCAGRAAHSVAPAGGSSGLRPASAAGRRPAWPAHRPPRADDQHPGFQHREVVGDRGLVDQVAPGPGS